MPAAGRPQQSMVGLVVDKLATSLEEKRKLMLNDYSVTNWEV